MRYRRSTFALLAVVTVAATVGCGPDSAPLAIPASPTPTPTATAFFATDDEAFAAAEEAYRAYIDAVNALDFGDPSTFTAAYDLATGKELRLDKHFFRRMHAERTTAGGAAVITLLEPYELSEKRRTATLLVCLEVGAVVLHDRDGNVIDTKGRADMQVLVARMSAEGDRYRVSEILNRDGGPDCE